MTSSARPRPLTAQATIASPLGDILLTRTEQGLAGLWFVGQKHEPGPLDAPERPDDELLVETTRQLNAYFAGELAAFDLPLDLHGTPFQQAVWQALLGIAGGATRSYGAIARQLGAPNANRAVGAAVGRNPVSLVVPCHRVVGSAGSLTGYAGGLERKQALLELEGVRQKGFVFGRVDDDLPTRESLHGAGRRGTTGRAESPTPTAGSTDAMQAPSASVSP
jgi:methylated-DNA-[protein]-cysteine S-methyltransferase